MTVNQYPASWSSTIAPRHWHCGGRVFIHSVQPFCSDHFADDTWRGAQSSWFFSAYSKSLADAIVTRGQNPAGKGRSQSRQPDDGGQKK
jgi:hypothetical protein